MISATDNGRGHDRGETQEDGVRHFMADASRAGEEIGS